MSLYTPLSIEVSKPSAKPLALKGSEAIEVLDAVVPDSKESGQPSLSLSRSKLFGILSPSVLVPTQLALGWALGI